MVLLFLAETEMVQIMVVKCVVVFVEYHNVGGVGNGDSWEGKKHVGHWRLFKIQILWPLLGC